MTIDMPTVSNCDITDCAYNREHNCHARAITIGDGMHPGCDTYFENKSHTLRSKQLAGVGACKVSACKYNSDFECSAEDIFVGKDKSRVVCMTFSAA